MRTRMQTTPVMTDPSTEQVIFLNLIMKVYNKENKIPQKQENKNKEISS